MGIIVAESVRKGKMRERVEGQIHRIEQETKSGQFTAKYEAGLNVDHAIKKDVVTHTYTKNTYLVYSMYIHTYSFIHIYLLSVKSTQ